MNHDFIVTAAKVIGLLVATAGLVRALGAPEFARAMAAILQCMKRFANWQLSSPQALFNGVQRGFRASSPESFFCSVHSGRSVWHCYGLTMSCTGS